MFRALQVSFSSGGEIKDLIYSKCTLLYLHTHTSPGTEVAKQHIGQPLLSGILTQQRTTVSRIESNQSPRQTASSPATQMTPSLSKVPCLYPERCVTQGNNMACLLKMEHLLTCKEKELEREDLTLPPGNTCYNVFLFCFSCNQY